MTEDGAHLGYGMEAALRGALAGERPTKQMTREEMREYILSAPDEPKSYDDGGRACAKLILEFLERHPEAHTMPADSEGEFGKKTNGETDWEDYHVTREGLDAYMKRVEPEWYESHAGIWDDLTGFMWGWGVNAARSCLTLPPVHNPAILTIRTK